MALRNRAAEKARRAAAGGDGPPAGRDPQVAGAPATAATADRGALRKRLRRARAARDVALHELGALVMEMHRQNRHDPALVERKAREAIAVDAEARAIAGALERGEPLAAFDATAGAGPGAAAAPPPSGRPVSVDAPPPTGQPLSTDAAPPTGEPVSKDAPPPSGDPVSLDAPPPSGDPVSTGEKPPSSGDGDDEAPTYSVTTR